MDSKEKSKRAFWQGVAAGVLVIVILGGVYLLGAKSNGSGLSLKGGSGGTVPTQPTQPTQPSAPTVDASQVVVNNDDHVRGNPNASLTVVEFSDFECPFCARFFPTVEQMLDEYGNDIKFVYKHFPLRSIHPQAQKAAEASECAADQGKFWEMHDAMFAMTSAGQTLSINNLKAKAAELGLNSGQFDSCLDNGEKAGDVEEDYQMGIAAGVTGTPSTFVGDQNIPGALPYAQVQSVIEAQL